MALTKSYTGDVRAARSSMQRAANPSWRTTANAAVAGNEWHDAWLLSDLLPNEPRDDYPRSEQTGGWQATAGTRSTPKAAEKVRRQAISARRTRR
jgi:hypothetical protein